MGKASRGVNPITIHGKDRFGRVIGVSVGRLHILREPSGELLKRVPIIVYREPTGAPGDALFSDENILADLNVDESYFLQHLYHLFPHGELDHGGESPLPPLTSLRDAIRKIIDLVEGLCQESRDAVTPLVILLRQLDDLDAKIEGDDGAGPDA